MRLGVRDLSVDFRTADGSRLPSVGPISFDVAEGEFVSILGPSGCGKSTLIRVLAGLQQSTTGSVIGDDKAITKPSAALAIMFQDANLMPWRTVLDNIALPLELNGVLKIRRYEIANKLLTQLHLEDFALAYPAELSGGMAQRVALGSGHHTAATAIVTGRTIWRARCLDTREAQPGIAADLARITANGSHGNPRY